MEPNARASFQHNTEIIASGYAYPSDVVDNDDFFRRCEFDITDDREALIADTRMETRRWCKEGEENTWTMARDAVRMAMSSGGLSPDEIDVVIVSSCSTIPMVNYPNPENPVVADLAPLVLKEIGRDGAFALDIKATYCAGFIRGLEIMDGLLAGPAYRTGLLVASDQGGRGATAPTNDSPFCFIVGDSAGAVVLRKTPRDGAAGIIDYVGGTVPSEGDLTAWGPDGVSMIVRRGAGKVALGHLIDAGRRLLARNGLAPKDVDWILPMQTHTGVIDALANGLEIPRARVLWEGNRTGYSASAAIPTLLSAKIHAGVVKPGDLVMSMAVGAGLNWAGALYRC